MTSTWRAGDSWDPGNPENRAQTRELQAQLRERLLAWDPIGVAHAPEAQDEYDCMLSPLMHQLHDGLGQGELEQWVRHELEDHFGLNPVAEADQAFVTGLIEWWSEATRA